MRRIVEFNRIDAKKGPIIAMTANAFTDDKIKSREAKMNAHISKPLKVESLIQLIHALVYKKGVESIDSSLFFDSIFAYVSTIR